MWGTEPGGSLFHYDDTSVGHDWGIGGVALIEGTTYRAIALGRYTEQNGLMAGHEYLWTTDILDTFETSYSELGVSSPASYLTETKHVGYTGGIWRGGDLLGKVAGLFDNDSTDAGILVGDLTGNYIETHNPDTLTYQGRWMTIGELDYVAMTSSSPGTMFIPTDIENFWLTGSGAGVGSSTISVDSMTGSMVGYNRIVSGEEQKELWGVFGIMGYGGYSTSVTPKPPTFHDWNMHLETSSDTMMWIEAHGTDHAENTIVGTSPGAWMSISDATTGVLGGEVIGTFDPSQWQVTVIGSWVETNKFFDILATNKAALQQLNIPVVEIGTANLEQVGSSVEPGSSITEAYMNNVVFFDHAQGGVTPRISATNEVGGNYSGSPGQNDFVNLEGNGLAAQMTIDNFTPSGNWGASVRGNGTAAGTSSPLDGQTIWMEGGAAGTVGTSSFSGTAAGAAGTGANPYDR